MHTLTGTATEPHKCPEYAVFPVAAERVDARTRAFADRHVRRLAAKMKLPPVTVRWYGPPADLYGPDGPPDGLLLGLAPLEEPATIALHRSLRPGALLLEALGHELWHLLERHRGRSGADHAEAHRFGLYVRQDWEDEQA